MSKRSKRQEKKAALRALQVRTSESNEASGKAVVLPSSGDQAEAAKDDDDADVSVSFERDATLVRPRPRSKRDPAWMNLKEPSGFVDSGFDTMPYWLPPKKTAEAA